MHINTAGWDLSLDLEGGRISSLSHKDVIVLGTYNRMDGKKGNSHLCVPSFDKEGQEKYLLPFHGYVRNLTWNTETITRNSLVISCKTPSSETYPAELFVEQEFELTDVFTHTIRIIHKRGNAVPVNIGCHYYWDTPQGWHKSLLNGKPIDDKIENNGYSPLEKDSIIAFPHARYELKTTDFHSVMLWTSFKTDQNKKEYSDNFCCIEPILGWPGFFGSKQSIITPGSAISASIQIKTIV